MIAVMHLLDRCPAPSQLADVADAAEQPSTSGGSDSSRKKPASAASPVTR